MVEYREDVDLTPAGLPGQVADYVNIGLSEDEHGSHVAGITSGVDLFGNANYDGQAPGAKLVSSRACSWGGGCTNAALTDGVVDLVVNRGVDVVNISIGGLPALNDANNARACCTTASSTTTASSCSSRPVTTVRVRTPWATPVSSPTWSAWPPR